MTNLFLASEILEINIEEERNGAAFYLALAEKSDNKLVQSVARDIANQEMTHEKKFKELLDRVQVRESEEQYPGEFDSYIDKLKGHQIFNNPPQAAETAKKTPDIEAIELALKTEYATLKLLNELRRHLDKSEIQYVDITIQEEEDHVKQLNDLLSKLV
jgi:rubrerythrin